MTLNDKNVKIGKFTPKRKKLLSIAKINLNIHEITTNPWNKISKALILNIQAHQLSVSTTVLEIKFRLKTYICLS